MHSRWVLVTLGECLWCGSEGLASHAHLKLDPYIFRMNCDITVMTLGGTLMELLLNSNMCLKCSGRHSDLQYDDQRNKRRRRKEQGEEQANDDMKQTRKTKWWKM